MGIQLAVLLWKVLHCIPHTGANRSSHEDFGKLGPSVRRGGRKEVLGIRGAVGSRVLAACRAAQCGAAGRESTGLLQDSTMQPPFRNGASLTLGNRICSPCDLVLCWMWGC